MELRFRAKSGNKTFDEPSYTTNSVDMSYPITHHLCPEYFNKSVDPALSLQSTIVGQHYETSNAVMVWVDEKQQNKFARAVRFTATTPWIGSLILCWQQVKVDTVDWR